MSFGSLSDILGDEPARRYPSDAIIASDTSTTEVHRLRQGVSLAWLCKAFRMPRSKVEARLRECHPIGTHRNGGYFYDLPEAAAYLVTPKQDLQAALKTLKAADLPDNLRESFWNAKIKEQRYRANAGDLWPTVAVLEVLGETNKTIKTTVQLWLDTVDEAEGLTDTQRQLITRLSDRLLDDIHKNLVKQARSNVTRSQLAELDDLAESA